MMAAYLLADCSQECLNVSHGFFDAIDRGNPDDAAALFDTDGTWRRGARVLRGPDAVRDELGRRDPDRVTCHLATNTMVRALGPDLAEVCFYLTVFEHWPAQGRRRTSTMRGRDELVRSGGAWKIRDKHVDAVLSPVESEIPPEPVQPNAAPPANKS